MMSLRTPWPSPADFYIETIRPKWSVAIDLRQKNVRIYLREVQKPCDGNRKPIPQERKRAPNNGLIPGFDNMIPSVKECFELMEQYGMLDNIKAHSIMVEKIAIFIGQRLKDAGMDISLEKITAGALLHDIGKTLCLSTGDDHAAEGREICLRNHLDQIADIVGEHVRLKDYHLDSPIGEKEIVYYADKRVNDDMVVSLEERLRYLIRRYAKNMEHISQRIRENFELCRAVEKKLFAKLDFRPEDLASLIR